MEALPLDARIRRQGDRLEDHQQNCDAHQLLGAVAARSFCCEPAASLPICRRMQPDSAAHPEAEIALLRSIAKGDIQAFEELYDRYANILFTAAYRILNQQQAAEDVLQ